MSIEASEGNAAAGASAGADLEAFLLGVLRLASVLNDSVIFARHGIGLAEWAVLRDIGAERIRLSQLWRRTRLSRQRVRVLVKELETNGATGAGYVTGPGVFPSALAAGATIGPAQTYGSAFSDNVSNQLIDEDYDNNGTFESYTGNFTPDNVVGNIEYIGVKFRFNDDAFGPLHYGWIGVDFTNQADLTGVVTGYAYESVPDTAIVAGAVPEPSGLALLALGAAGLLVRRKQVA